jgi:hypothetical protein
MSSRRFLRLFLEFWWVAMIGVAMAASLVLFAASLTKEWFLNR